MLSSLQSALKQKSLALTWAGLSGFAAAVATPLALAEPAKVQPKTPTSSANEVHGLRTALELEAVLLLGWTYYLTTADLPGNFDVGYRWDVFARKISGGSFVFDTNHFGTNFVGHPLGGAGYYLAGRTNGIGTLGSSALAIAGSAIWELFGEVHEEISMNDMIVTPMAGIAIGETTYQLGRFFDRAEGTLFHRALGLLFGPLTSLNNFLDDSLPARVAFGYPEDVWFQVYARAALQQVQERESRQAPFELELATRIHIEDFEPPRKPKPFRQDWFSDGNVSELRAEVAMSALQLARVAVTTQSVLAGMNYAAAREATDAEFGYLGLAMGFAYSARRYQRSGHEPLNRLSSVRPLGLASGHHVRRGALSLDSSLSLGVVFGGVDSLALTSDMLADPQLPPVMRLHGYYMGWGQAAETELQLGYRDLRIGAALSFEQYKSSHAPGEEDVTPMTDALRLTNAYLGYRIPNTSFELRAFWSWLDRLGTLNQQHRDVREQTTGLQLCAFAE